jgi:cytoskeletal protein RodZ
VNLLEIGELLKQNRLTKGYSLDDIEEATKIRAKYLEALENEEFDILPGQVYVIAFLRNYARFLGLNDDEMVEQYKSRTQSNPQTDSVKKDIEDKEPIVNDRPRSRERTRRQRRRAQPQFVNFVKILAAVAVIAVVFAIASIYKTYAPGPDVPEQPNVVQDNANEDKPNNNTNNTETPAPDENMDEETPEQVEGVELVLNVTDANCWMRINVDGQIAFEGTVPAGDTKEFSGSESIDITLGNAGVVDVKYNGEDIGKLGPMGQVVNEQFVPKQG